MLDEMRSYQNHGEAPICIHCRSEPLRGAENSDKHSDKHKTGAVIVVLAAVEQESCASSIILGTSWRTRWGFTCQHFTYDPFTARHQYVCSPLDDYCRFQYLRPRSRHEEAEAVAGSDQGDFSYSGTCNITQPAEPHFWQYFMSDASLCKYSLLICLPHVITQGCVTVFLLCNHRNNMSWSTGQSSYCLRDICSLWTSGRWASRNTSQNRAQQRRKCSPPLVCYWNIEIWWIDVAKILIECCCAIFMSLNMNPDNPESFCLSGRWRWSPLPLDPTQKTSTRSSNQQIQSTSSKSSSRKEISYLSTKIPHHPRPKMYLSWETMTHNCISNRGTSYRTPPQRAPGPRRSPRTAVKSFCCCTVHHHQLWQQPFVWWWRTPTLTRRWVLHQRRHHRTLLRNGDAALSSLFPRCCWTTTIWSQTLPPQVSDSISRAAVGHVWAPQMLTEVHVTGTVDTDEEIPPPLPQRTPESYILAADAG